MLKEEDKWKTRWNLSYRLLLSQGVQFDSDLPCDHRETASDWTRQAAFLRVASGVLVSVQSGSEIPWGRRLHLSRLPLGHWQQGASLQRGNRFVSFTDLYKHTDFKVRGSIAAAGQILKNYQTMIRMLLLNAKINRFMMQNQIGDAVVCVSRCQLLVFFYSKLWVTFVNEALFGDGQWQGNVSQTVYTLIMFWQCRFFWDYA